MKACLMLEMPPLGMWIALAIEERPYPTYLLLHWFSLNHISEMIMEELCYKATYQASLL